MDKIKSLYKILSILVLSAITLSTELTAQESYFKFPVTRDGVYKITAAQAEKLGAASVEELSLYGYDGMLPQHLDSSSLELKEIPVKHVDGELFFFLAAPDQIERIEHRPHFQPHHYTDTLYYLVQSGKPPTKTISSSDLPASQGAAESPLYQLVIYKNSEYNLLSSGRDWYGERIFDGETIILNFEQKLSQNLPLYYQGKFLSQSHSSGTMELSINKQSVASLTFPSIPPTTYGIKGQLSKTSGFIESFPENQPIQTRFNYRTSDRNGTAYLDYFMIGLPFPSPALPEGIYYSLNEERYNIGSRAENIWDISNFFEVKDISSNETVLSGADKIAVFKSSNVPQLLDFEQVDLNLRFSPTYTELIIITHPALLTQAQRLSHHKNSIGISSQVVTVQEIYSSFGHGNPDVTAIRNFLAFHYHQGKKLKNVLLFGKGTYDYKKKLGGRPNLVPTYSSRSSLNPLTTYSSDDYFGFMDFGEGLWEETSDGDHKLDIGVGRLPVINVQESKTVVDKIIHYSSPASALGDWKRKILFIADDGDNNVHLNDSELLAAYLSQNHPELTLEKLYLDNYEQIPNGAVQSSPHAKTAFETLLDSSSLIVNYIGHGNETTLMAEELFTVADLNNWRPNDKLPVFITATCEFGRHDNPRIRSGAEELLIAEKKGAIAVLSTSRPAFSNVNFDLNKAVIEHAFTTKEGQPLTLGEIFMQTKNNSLNGPLSRNFSLLGDPSLHLAAPELTVQIEELVGAGKKASTDRLSSMVPVRYRAKVVSVPGGETVTSFNGNFQVVLSGPPASKTTLGDENEPGSYRDEQITLHRGKGKVENGVFEGQLLIPENDHFSLGQGTIRFFAVDTAIQREASGANKVLLGGSSQHQSSDQAGPKIQLSLDSSPAGHPISSSTAQITVLLEDPSGININPLQVGNELSIRINQGERITLNEYYQAIDGSFTQGMMNFPISGLTEGKNTVFFEAYDNYGNSTSSTLEIKVTGSGQVQILSHLVFPNPATLYSRFRLTHNREGENLLLSVTIFSLSGSEIFSTSRRFPKAGPLLDDVSYVFIPGKSSFPAKGTYLYILELRSEADGASDRKSGTLLIQ